MDPKRGALSSATKFAHSRLKHAPSELRDTDVTSDQEEDFASQSEAHAKHANVQRLFCCAKATGLTKQAYKQCNTSSVQHFHHAGPEKTAGV